MAKEYADTLEKGYDVTEWTIDNFSCWNTSIHGKKLRSPELDFCYYLDLFRGGHEKGLGVHIYHSLGYTFNGDLSFISSDGTILCTLIGRSDGKSGSLEFPPGPKFEDVVSHIRKNEAVHGDRLTLKFLTEGRERLEYLHSTIIVFDVSFQFNNCPEILKRLQTNLNNFLLLTLPFNGKDIQELKIKITKTQSSRLTLTLNNFACKRKFNFILRMTVLSYEDVVRTEEDEHFFQETNEWTFSDSLTIEELEKEGMSFYLYFKIVCDKKLKGFGFSTNFLSLVSSNRFRCSNVSLSEELLTALNPSLHSMQNLSKQLMCLYQDQDFSDLTLKCDNVSIPVHKAILSARSPVFKTMFSCDMREAASREVVITDLDPPTLACFLAFLYTGVVGEELQGESALNLYYAADKYQVSDLKKECADFLCDNVSVSNVCDILSLANRHQDDQMSSAVHEFFLENYNEVLRSEEWKIFMEREPLLAVKTVTHFGDKNYVSRSKTT